MKKRNQTSRIAIIIAALTTSCGVCLADDTATNLLTNGGFENGLAPWRDFNTGAQTETTDVAEGKTAICLKKGTGVNYAIDGLKPGTKYRLTAKMKVANLGESVRLFAQGYDKTNPNGTGALGTAQVWTEVTLEFQTGANDTSAEVGAWKDAGLGDGNAFIDDFKLVEEK